MIQIENRNTKEEFDNANDAAKHFLALFIESMEKGEVFSPIITTMNSEQVEAIDK
jgi:hypothetical protein